MFFLVGFYQDILDVIGGFSKILAVLAHSASTRCPTSSRRSSRPGLTLLNMDLLLITNVCVIPCHYMYLCNACTFQLWELSSIHTHCVSTLALTSNVCVRVHVCAYTSGCVCACVHARMYLCVYGACGVCVCMYVHTQVCVYVCQRAVVWVCLHVHVWSVYVWRDTWDIQYLCMLLFCVCAWTSLKDEFIE